MNSRKKLMPVVRTIPFLLIMFGLFLRHTPSQINLHDIQEELPRSGSQLGEYVSGQEVTFTVHVLECRRYEHTDSPPSVGED